MNDKKELSEPVVNEVFADNGEHSHWELIDTVNGRILWSEYESEKKKEEVKQQCIALLKWVNRKEAKYAPMYDSETWAGNEEDITTEQLYELFEQNK